MAGVLDALASYVQSMLTKMATQELHMLLGISGEIDNMDVKLGDLKNFLADADRRSITDQSVQAWVRELRGALYDATDIVDLCQLKAMERGPTRDAGCFNPLLFCMRNPLHAHDIGSRIKKLNQKLDNIKERSSTFRFLHLSSYEDRSKRVASSRLATRRETTGEINESSVVGEKIQEDTRIMVKMLTEGEETSCQSNKIVVFAIVGVGGIGKTTLAKKIFNDDIIQQEFTKKLWLSVNQDFSPTELLRRAITEVGGDHQAAGNVRSTLERTLKEALMGHKTLVVMDDVWDPQAWVDVLKTPLVNVLAQGSRVLVTTRNDMVARGMMAKVPYHRVDKLHPEDAWSLLRKQVVHHENDDEAQIYPLKDIGMKIIEKCECLPLAVKVMGGLLCQKESRRRDWENVLHDSIWPVSQMPEELNYALYLSYEDLHPCLKPCFLHYCLLPKNTLFYADDIVGMWISEGFVHGNSRSLEELGREYYNELILRNLIEPNPKFVGQPLCTMHDVVRSFGQYVARDETSVARNSEIGISGKSSSTKFIRFSLETGGSDSNQLEWCSLEAQVSLRTLISIGHIKIKPDDSLVTFPSLRTLHINSSDFDPLAESLYHLKHLRYLSIRFTNTSRLPESIGKMKLLQHIDLLGCRNLVKLPSSIRELPQLSFLNIDGTSIGNIPRGFGSLTNLRRLYGFPAHMDGDWCSLEECESLSQLIALGITGLENVSSCSSARKAWLGEKFRLSILSLACTSRLGDDGRLVKVSSKHSDKELRQIEGVFDELCPPPCLETLRVYGYFGQRLPRWMMSTSAAPLLGLRVLVMNDLACCTELPDGLCQLSCLEHLQVERAPAIKRVGPEFLQPYHHRHNRSQVATLFPRLEQLRLTGMVEWEEWEWEEQVHAMPVLDLLTLQRCKLRRVPPGLAFHARALRLLHVINVEHLRSLENFASVVDLEVFESPDLETISNFSKLQKLVIFKCPKLKVLEGVPGLQRLELRGYDMSTLPGYLQNVNPRILQVDCTLTLLTSIAAVKSSPEWDKFSHIQQVKANASAEGIPRKWHVLYTRDPFNFETNISGPAIAQGRMERASFPYLATCPIEEEWSIGRRAHTDKRQPLCLRFRWQAYAHLVPWLHRSCLHCNEAAGVAASSDQWVQESSIGSRGYILLDQISDAAAAKGSVKSVM